MKTLDELVKQPLTLQQVKKFLPGVPVILYKQLKALTTLPPALVYLFLTSDGFGHFCCVMRRGDVVELFDSYGIKPESEHSFVSEEMLQHLGERDDYILDLCKRNGWSVVHNTKCLQGREAETCGRHCVSRIRKEALPIKDYVRWLEAVAAQADTTPDIVVSYLVS